MTTQLDQPKICSICFLPFIEWGNNAQPVNDGRCCNDCNWNVVLPARLALHGLVTKVAEHTNDDL
jgi:hypothetical protein